MVRAFIVTITEMGMLGPETRQKLAEGMNELEELVVTLMDDLDRGEIEGFQVERDEQ